MMGDPANDETDEAGSAPTREPTAKKEKTGSFQFLKSDDDRYDPKDIRSPLTVRLLIEHIDRLESEVTELKSYRSQFYGLKSENSVLASEADLSWSSKAISSALLAAGGAGVGASPSFFDQGYKGIIFLVFSLSVAIASFFIKVKIK